MVGPPQKAKKKLSHNTPRHQVPSREMAEASRVLLSSLSSTRRIARELLLGSPLWWRLQAGRKDLWVAGDRVRATRPCSPRLHRLHIDVSHTASRWLGANQV